LGPPSRLEIRSRYRVNGAPDEQPDDLNSFVLWANAEVYSFLCTGRPRPI
jgi:hypothetical protein